MKLLTQKQVAERLKRSVPTIRMYIEKFGLPEIRMGPRQCYFEPSVVDAWAAKNLPKIEKRNKRAMKNSWKSWKWLKNKRIT